MARDPTCVVLKDMFLQNQFPYHEVRRPFILGTQRQQWKATLFHRFLAVWKSTSASGAPDNSSLSHFSAMTRPSWLRRAARNRHRHAIEQASRRWRGGRRDDSARTRRKLLISTQVEPDVRKRGVATALFSRAEEIVREWNLNEFLLTCVRHHEPSYNLYRKLGFEEVDAEIARDSDSVMMRKFVPTPTRTD